MIFCVGRYSMRVSLRYSIVLHKSEEGYAVSCPALPGCWSQRASEEEAVENIRDAIREYLAFRERAVCRRARAGH